MGDVSRFKRVGGHPAIDFVNTLGGLPERPHDEYLTGYGDLLTWAEGAGLLAAGAAASLGRAAVGRPVRAARVLDDALGLRAHLDQVLRAGLERRPPEAPAGALDAIGAAGAAALARAELRPGPHGYRWTWPAPAPGELEAPLWPITGQVIDLLVHGSLARLARCGHCRWLFLDDSRNHSRRWCSMEACGAVVKMRRYRAGRGARPARAR